MENLTDFLLNTTWNVTQIEDNEPYNPWAFVPFYIVLVFLTIAGIVFNIVTIIVIVRHKSMHTTTNYYLFSLAISDLILAFASPMTMACLLICIYHEMDCEALMWHTDWLFRMASVAMDTSSMTITLFTVERYMAICHPLYFLKLSQKKRVLQYIAIIWAFSLAVNIRIFVWELSHSSESLLDVLHFLVPFVTITILCSLMIYNIKKSKMVPGKSSKDNKSSEKPLQILVAIIITFFICWFPILVHEVLEVYFEFQSPFYTNMAVIFLGMSTILNPLIYSILSTKFRKALLESFNRRNATVTSREDSSTKTSSQQRRGFSFEMNDTNT